MDLSRVSFARSLERKRGIYTEQIYEIIIFCFRWFDCLYTGCLFFFRMGNTCSVDSFENVFTGLINWLGEILTKVKDRIVKFTRTIFQTIRDAVLYAFEIQELRQKRAEAASTVNCQVRTLL